MLAFVEDLGVGVFPNINDEQGELWVRYGVSYQPAFVFIRADGSSESFGGLNESDLQGHIDRMF